MENINMVEAIRSLKNIHIASAVDEYMAYLQDNYHIRPFQLGILVDTAERVKAQCVSAVTINDVPTEWLRNIGIVK